jgi:hypothetical protein
MERMKETTPRREEGGRVLEGYGFEAGAAVSKGLYRDNLLRDFPIV